jgi:hypothetical protein
MVSVSRVDDLWGEYEWMLYLQPFYPNFPYLPWIPLPPHNSFYDILYYTVDKKMWQPYTFKTNTHLIQSKVLDKLRVMLRAAKATIEVPFHEVITSFSFHYLQHAYTWAFKAIDHLKHKFNAW